MKTEIPGVGKIRLLIYIVCLLICVFPHSGICDSEDALTFFGWSDQHIKTDGDGTHLIPAIDAMNALPQMDYPADIGGKVAEPDFVIGLGDITEWPTQAAKNTYEKLITGRLKYPSYDAAGNHDSGGLSPSPTIHNWLIKRHGSLSYTFSKKGVLFVVLYSKFDDSLNNPAQPISEEALEYLRNCLSKVKKGTPVVVATHLCFESITNKDEFIDAFGDANVILVLGGHYHKASVNIYKNINFVQMPSPASGSPSEITVIRIGSERLVAVPFDYEKFEWSSDPKKILNTRIKGPQNIPHSPLSTPDNPDNDDTAMRQSLFLDNHFRDGFLLSYPSSKRGFAAEAVLNFDNPDNKPIWRLCQWGTKQSLAKARCIHHVNGDLSYGNEARTVLVGAQDSDNRDLVLEIRGSAEYGNKARKYGESWPHLLVEQQVRKNYPLDELAGLHFYLKIKLLYSKDLMIKEEYDPGLHAAQFQMFLVVKNVNEQSKDYMSYYWFGVPFYDSRYDIPPSFKAKDAGKADATGKFIYTIAGREVNTSSLKLNEWAEIDTDLLPYIKDGLKEAVDRGYFKSSNPGDYAVAAMNMGWELPGTFDASIQIRDFDILTVLR